MRTFTVLNISYRGFYASNFSAVFEIIFVFFKKNFRTQYAVVNRVKLLLNNTGIYNGAITTKKNAKYPSTLREAFKKKTRKYIGLFPLLGGGYPPNQYISGFFLRKKHL